MAAWTLSKLWKSQGRYRPDGGYRFEGADIKRDITDKYGPQGELLEIFVTTKDSLVHKWHHYLPLYERYFAPFRTRSGVPLRFLEIGVSQGGSLDMWRRYFGPEAIIFGIDIDPACAAFNGKAGQVRIGSQDDPAFLRAVVEEMGGVDLVLDDGSHVMAHIKASLLTLFPLVSPGGIYMIEDLHSAYWKDFGGGHASPANVFNFIRSSVDDMHRWYHQVPVAHPEVAMDLTGIHVHDSIVVLDKAKVYPPTHSRVGVQAGRKAKG